MNLSVDENGIIIKKLFKSVTVTYSEIKSIVNKDGYTYINTRYGDTYKHREPGEILGTYLYLTESSPELYEFIEKYNIEFRDEDLLADNQELYSFDEAVSAAQKTMDLIKSVADELIKEKIGPEFELNNFYVEDKFGITRVCLGMNQNGYGFDIPDEAIDYVDSDALNSFETVQLFRGPAVWHPESYSGEYVLYEICKSEDVCRKEITDIVQTFIEKAVPYIRKLTL